MYPEKVQRDVHYLRAAGLVAVVPSDSVHPAVLFQGHVSIPRLDRMAKFRKDEVGSHKRQGES